MKLRRQIYVWRPFCYRKLCKFNVVSLLHRNNVFHTKNRVAHKHSTLRNTLYSLHSFHSVWVFESIVWDFRGCVHYYLKLLHVKQ